MNLREIQDILFIEYQKNGYFDMWNNCFKINEKGEFIDNFRFADIAELGLITTEISEAQEVVRRNIFIPHLKQQLKIECSDIIIRTLNFMSRKSMDAESGIIQKNKVNLTRGLKHGKVV